MAFSTDKTRQGAAGTAGELGLLLVQVIVKLGLLVAGLKEGMYPVAKFNFY